MSFDEAQAQATAYVRQSVEVFPRGASLVSVGPAVTLPCSDSDEAPGTTPVSIQPGFWVHGIGASGNEKYLTDFVEYWTALGWQVSLDRRPTVQLVVLTSSSGFEVVMQLTVDGTRASVRGASPCVRPRRDAATGPGRAAG